MNDQKRRRTRGIGLLIVVLAVGLAALAGITLLQLMDARPAPVSPAGTSSVSAAAPPAAAPDGAVTVGELRAIVSSRGPLTEPVAGVVGGAYSRQRCGASGLGAPCRLSGH